LSQSRAYLAPFVPSLLEVIYVSVFVFVCDMYSFTLRDMVIYSVTDSERPLEPRTYVAPFVPSLQAEIPEVIYI